MNLGLALQFTKGFTVPDVHRAYSRAYELCGQLGYPPQLSQVLFGLWLFYHTQSKLQQALDLANQMLTQAENLQHRVHLLVAHWVMGATRAALCEYASARSHLEKALISMTGSKTTRWPFHMGKTWVYVPTSF